MLGHFGPKWVIGEAGSLVLEASCGDRSDVRSWRFCDTRDSSRMAVSEPEAETRGCLLQRVAGFGIGTYTFRVLYWVVVITVFGALYLKESVKGVRDEKHGFIWISSLRRPSLPGLTFKETRISVVSQFECQRRYAKN
jgi:hypothetical protein